MSVYTVSLGCCTIRRHNKELCTYNIVLLLHFDNKHHLLCFIVFARLNFLLSAQTGSASCRLVFFLWHLGHAHIHLNAYGRLASRVKHQTVECGMISTKLETSPCLYRRFLWCLRLLRVLLSNGEVFGLLRL